eukprot:TRINITY_DN6869_c0_g1_i2.p2 TRINITY_DN6869_c0_g1~~TRINITY_DN6869_c0_g1_i2.p2  ORF type:complete len:120 (+),score=28.11 TRINITY_DN6869_c0_g1_i2:130-489(+)
MCIRDSINAEYGGTSTMHMHTTAQLMAVACVASGVAGYYNKGTKASLAVGAALGSIYIAADGMLQTHNLQGYGRVLAGVVSVALVGRMGMYYAKTGELMPALFLTVCGGISAAKFLDLW